MGTCLSMLWILRRGLFNGGCNLRQRQKRFTIYLWHIMVLHQGPTRCCSTVLLKSTAFAVKIVRKTWFELKLSYPSWASWQGVRDSITVCFKSFVICKSPQITAIEMFCKSILRYRKSQVKSTFKWSLDHLCLVEMCNWRKNSNFILTSPDTRLNIFRASSTQGKPSPSPSKMRRIAACIRKSWKF